MSTVLIVEDDADVRHGLVTLMELRGYTVDTAANGKEALEKLRRRRPPCIVLLDLIMPEMDGWALRRSMLAEPALARVPVVVLSAVADIHEQARSLNAVDYLRKPVDFNRLYDIVATYC
jgi:CheY-like chemotaxis protein